MEFSRYIIAPWPSVWFRALTYAKIQDSYGTIFIRTPESPEIGISHSEEVWLNYSGGRTWITFHIKACYILASPVLAFLTPEISITFYVRDITNPVCAMKTDVNGYFYVPNIARGLLKVEFLFDNPRLVGDQTGATSPYSTITAYPDGYVGIGDVVFIADHAMSNEGDPNWNYMADVTADRYIGTADITAVADNFGGEGTYITGLSNVTVTFNTGEVKTPDANGFVTIPYGATSFNVTRYGNPIGAMIIFW